MGYYIYCCKKYKIKAIYYVSSGHNTTECLIVSCILTGFYSFSQKNLQKME